ncbi:hypothetical protein CN235_19975 [Sinorhizobium meliloti]|uniref:hypothetical protein n=1 Tax=Rhizobium meliloti TaxID=382 RepID=UPI000FD53BB9|nr:hypothetical protein [Sinorhizobium meliloti]RVE91039.1 hypothetical protein CN235_19975 [Sinorhizobium meliloti]
MTEEFQELLKQIEAVKADLDVVLVKLVEARRNFHANRSEQTEATLDDVQDKASQLQSEYSRLIALLPAASGLPPEEFQRLSQSAEPAQRNDDHLNRENLTVDRIAASAYVDDYLAAALERVMYLLPAGWLEEEPREAARVTPLAGPDAFLSLTKGVRRESEYHAMHRLRQTIYVARDYLSGELFYDQFAGALLVPTLTKLALQGHNLGEVGGERDERLDHLWRGPSGQVDATFFELLTAAACAEKGRSVDFLPATHEKSPDLRCHDPIPLLIECKRQDALSQYELSEETIMRQLFVALRVEAQKRGLCGTFQLELVVEAAQIDIKDVVSRFINQRLAPNPARKLAYPWGAVAFIPSASKVWLRETTRLYSPHMLEHLFGWESDLPAWDGICCSIDAKGEPEMDLVVNPISLIWRNNSEKALKKRSWAPINLFSKASLQIPPGEFGIVYVNYIEGARAGVANMRLDAYAGRLQEFEHSDKIRLPISLLVRLYPRSLGHGQPDLIESSVQYLSGLYGDKELFDFFPSMIFTHVSNEEDGQ